MSDEPKIPKWGQKLFETVEHYWNHHGPCNHINFNLEYNSELKLWNAMFAPAFQEVFGGEDDGKTVWTGFLFEAGKFSRLTGVEIQDWAIASACKDPDCIAIPRVMIKGKYKGHKIILQIWQEPPKDTEPLEIVDVAAKEIRNKNNE